jgi:hypothetical protein
MTIGLESPLPPQLDFVVVAHVDGTERRGRVVNSPTPYSGDLGFDPWSRLPAVLIEVFRGFP